MCDIMATWPKDIQHKRWTPERYAILEQKIAATKLKKAAILEHKMAATTAAAQSRL